MAKYNLDNYFDKDGLGFPLNFRRGNPNPLDNSSVWKSFVDAQNYAQNDPTAYVGQILSVVDNENAVVDVYKINDTAGNLILVGTVTLGDDQSIVKNEDDTLSLYDFGKKYYKFVAAEGDVVAHYEVTEGWKDGLEPKVSGGVLAWYEPNPTTVDGIQPFINMLQAQVDTAEIAIKSNTDAIGILNGDKTTEGSVAYQIAAIIAGADTDFDTLKEIADWIAAHPDSVAAINAAIQDNADSIKALETLVGTDPVVDQISSAIENLKIFDYAKAADLNAAIEDICANTDTIEILHDLVGERTVDERINAAVKETVDGAEQDKFALRVHGHTISDVDGLDVILDTKATNDIVNAIELRVQAIEDGRDIDVDIDFSAINNAIDTAIQEHNNASDLKYETIENVAQLSSNIDAKVDELQRTDADNLIAAQTYTETKITELNITQYAKQSDLEIVQANIDTVKDHPTVDSFTDVMDEIAKKQDIIPENTYDSYGASTAVDSKLEMYKIEANDRLLALESVDNVTHDEMDAAINILEDADLDILAKIGDITDDNTVVDLIDAVQVIAYNAKAVAEAAQGDIDTLETIVGSVPAGSDTIIAYINKKAQEVLDAATGGSSESAISVKLALDNYIAENDLRVQSNTTAASNAQSKANDAYELAATKVTIDDVNAAIEDSIYVVTEEFNAIIDDINNKIGEVPAYSTVMEEIEKIKDSTIYDDTDVRSLIDANTQAIAQEITDREGAISDIMTEFEGMIDTKVEQADYDTMVNELSAEDARLIGLIDDNTEAINDISTKIYDLVDTDIGKSVRAIANEELAAQLIPENAAEALGTLQEIAAWIQEHPNDASDMNAAIEELYAKIDIEDQTVSAYVNAAINALSIGDYATVDALNAAIERIVVLEGNGATKDELMAVYNSLDEYKQAHNSDYDNADVDAKVQNLQDQIDVLSDTYATDVELIDAIDAEIERADGAYAGKTYEVTVDSHIGNVDIHVTIDDKYKWDSAQANAEDIAASNLAAARIEITEEISAAKDEIIDDTEDKIATAKAEVIFDAEDKIDAVQNELQSNIDTISNDLNTYKVDNDVAVGLKANIADVYNKAEVEAMLTWGEF